MPSVEKCQEILNKKGAKFTRQEAEKLRNLLMQFAEIEYSSYISNTNEKSSDIHPGLNR